MVPCCVVAVDVRCWSLGRCEVDRLAWTWKNGEDEVARLEPEDDLPRHGDSGASAVHAMLCGAAARGSERLAVGCVDEVIDYAMKLVWAGGWRETQWWGRLAGNRGAEIRA